MTIAWITPQGDLGTYTERVIVDPILLEATSDVGEITFTVIAGSLPRGLRLVGNAIKGSPTEVRRFTINRFVIRADDGIDIEDRTFSISVDGSDVPEWVTKAGYLQVGLGEAYFVLDNSRVEFQLEAYDPDVIAGDKLEYYLMPMGGQLPPGLSLSSTGLISGYTDPIFAVDYNASINGGYDTGSFDITPIDFVESKSNGFDDYFFDTQTYDYNEPSRLPKKLSRSYSFVVAVTDGANIATRSFKIYVVTTEFLTADNSIVQVGTNVFTADSSSDRVPLWITESNLGRYRANNYITLFLDVYDPPSLEGTITYFLLPTNLDQTESILPPGLELDTITGELAGRVPYQSKVSKQYNFTIQAVNFPQNLYESSYNFKNDWNSSTNYSINDAVRYLGFIYICKVSNRNVIPTNTSYWTKGVSSSEKQFTVEIVGEIESSINWISDSDLGTIKPNQSSQLYVEAEALIYGSRISYEFISGRLPPGLEFLSNGKIQGKIKQFADADGPGLTRFYDVNGTEKTYNTTWDGNTTSFDKKFTFVIEARDSLEFSKSQKTFYFTVIADNEITFANLYLKAFQSKEKRLAWSNFITDATIFVPNEIYRYGDTNFGVQTELKMLLFAGIESTTAVKYVQAMSRNHYRKQILFGDIKIAKAKDPITQEVIYETVYIQIEDDLEKDGASISRTVELSNDVESKVLVSYDAIKVDSDIPFASDSDHQRVFPNSVYNMRKRMQSVGKRDRTFLPLWMRSIQDTAMFETGYVKALILCYAMPGKGQNIVSRIKSRTTYASRGTWSPTTTYQVGDSISYKGNFWTCISSNINLEPVEGDFWIQNFNFRDINFTADRYLIDILNGEIEDKYLAFPQRGEKLP